MKNFYLIILLSISGLISAQTYFEEDFSEGEIPENWEIIQTNTNKTWGISLQQPNGSYEAVVTGDPSGGQEDEWLITPSVDLTAAESPVLYFETNYSDYYLITENVADYKAYISTDDGENWEEIWTETDGYMYWDYTYQVAIINLDIQQYAGNPNVKFAFQLFTPSATHECSTSVWIPKVIVEENQQSPVENITVSTVDGEDTTVVVGDWLQLVATVSPENSNPTVNWSVSDGEEFAVVDSYGYVDAINPGVATIRATSVENDEIYGEIEITVIEDPFNNGCNQRFSSIPQYVFSINKITNHVGANDFIIPGGTAFILESFTPTLLAGSISSPQPDAYDSFDLTIRNDNSGVPGSVIETYTDLAPTLIEDGALNKVRFEFPEPLTLSGNENGTKYWITLTASNDLDIPIGWSAYDYSAENETSFSYRSMDGGETWEPLSFEGTGDRQELIFDIEGTCEELNVSDLNNSSNLIVYPNPTNGIININSLKQLYSLELFDMTGKLVQSYPASNKQINLSNFPSGVYILKAVDQAGKTNNIKIIRK